MKIKVLHEHKLLQIVDATQIEIDQLNISLEKQIEGWAFKKKFYSGWDGKVKFIKGNLIPFGLWKEVYDICQRFKFELEIENLSSYFSGISLEDFQSWVTEQFEGNALQPRDYQVETAWKIIKYKSCLGELATSAGKTLITFMVFSYLIKVLKFEKILMIVPNVTLVEQADGDFYEYNDPKIIDYEIQLIYSGKKIKKSSNIVVGTYQSLVKKPKEFFAQFDAVCIDECLHPDTLITMSDGSEKKISEINSGDLVYTTNDRTLKQEIKEVDFVYTNLSKGNQMYEIEMENGSTIKITGNHKVKLISGEYKRADQLTEDDEILSLEDYFMKIKSIKKIDYKDEVFNLRIKSEDGLNHNYIANGLNVANCHKMKANSIKTILQKCKHTHYTFGVSGTIPKPGTLDRLTLMSQTGPVVSEVGTRFLIDKGHITPVEIKVIKLNYAPEKIREAFFKASQSADSKRLYNIERDYIIENKQRLDFVCKTISTSKKNSLVLFHRVAYGKALYNKLRDLNRGREIYYVDGSTPTETREVYKRKMEQGDNVILVASYGTFSTGVSIRKIFSIFFTESYKSEVIVRQSIGRGLRKHHEKSKLLIIDFTDDFSLKRDGKVYFNNFMIRHMYERLKIYKDVELPYQIKSVNL